MFLHVAHFLLIIKRQMTKRSKGSKVTKGTKMIKEIKWDKGCL
jgi:hypothetical protein